MDSSINLELVLVVVTLVTGLIILFYKWDNVTEHSSKYVKHGLPLLLTGPLWLIYYFLTHFPATSKSPSSFEEPLLVDYAKSFFPIFLLVVLLRSFVAEPFRIPSGSMIPTLEIGDFVLVKKFSYGIRLPILHNKVIDIDTPERGDVVVFRYPPEPEIHYIKRLIGLPGDLIEWTRDKKLIINGVAVEYKDEGEYTIKSSLGEKQIVPKLSEILPNGKKETKRHNLIHFPYKTKAGKWKVPPGHYFMMGDNRDNSGDSRFWGFVPEENLVGKASLVWMHWNWFDGGDGFQPSRIGTAVN